MLKLLRKIKELLPPSNRKKLVILFILMVVAAILEVAGIGVILTFISFVSEPDKLTTISWLSPIIESFGISTSRDLMIYGSIALIFIFIIKNIYLIAFYYFQSHFIYNRYRLISTKLFNRYMKAPYVYHLNHNTAQLIRNVTVETRLMVQHVMMPILIVTMESIMIISIIVFLTIVEPLTTSVVIILVGGAGYAFLRVIKSRVKKYGRQAQDERANLIKKVNEGLGGIKETIVRNKQSWFIKSFFHSVKTLGKAEAFREAFRRSGKPIIETVAVTGMLAISLILVWQGRGIESIIPVLTLFGVATFKLLPSLDKVINQYNKLRYYTYTLEPVHRDMLRLAQPKKKNEKRHATTKSLNKKLDLVNVFYSYPDNPEPVINGVSLTIDKGDFVGFVGESGSGKTTIVDMILGLLPCQKGKIEVDGKNIIENLLGWQQNIGYIPQFIYLSDNTIRNNIAFGINKDEIKEEQVQNAIKMAQLEGFIASLPEGLDTMVGERGVRLSGGQRQRIGIARALYHNPEVLVMDEATSSLDNKTERSIIDSLEQLKKDRTIIMVAHRLTTVKNCDILFLIKEGRLIAQGNYQDLLKKSTEFINMVNASGENNSNE